MTTEALRADLSHETVYTAQPPSECLNGCESRQGSPASKVWCEPGQRLCPKCAARLDRWLRDLPGNYGLLLWVKDHGTVPSDPGTKHTKRPDPPAPMRLEVVDLLDNRRGIQFDDDGNPILGDNRRGVFGTILAWSSRVRLDRDLPRSCDCGHAASLHRWAPPLASLCRANCRCVRWGVSTTLSKECAYLITNLPWATGQDFAGELYEEIRVLARTLNDTVGEYRPKPVGKCAALRPVPESTEQVLCGGALVMDKPTPEDEDQTTSVKCLTCGRRHEANSGLRALGLIVGAMFGENRIDQEAS